MKTSKQAALSALLGVIAFAGLVKPVLALDYRSVGTSAAIMYDAPSEKGRRIWIAPRGMPVEVVLMYGNWIKVRDASGDLSWIKKEQLSDDRTVVISANPAEIRAAASDTAPVVFSAARGVVLHVEQQPETGWLRVRHADGQEGFVRLADVWGATR